MGDAPTSTPPKPSSRIVLPSLAELERQQAEEDAEDLEIFWEPKKRKLTETPDEPDTSLNALSSPPSSVLASAAPPVLVSPQSSNSILSYRPHTGASNSVKVVERQKYEPGQVATGAAVDTSCLLIHERQKNNPILNQLRQVKWQYTPDIVPDFQFGANQCGLYLTMKFHQQNGAYILNRIASIPGHYVVRILLVLVDLDDHEQVLLNLNQIAVLRDVTLVLAFSIAEVARYLETYKSFENTNADALKEAASTGDHFEQARVALGAIKSISSADVANLLLAFGTVAKIFTASLEQLATVPGLGEKKILALYNAFHDPILTSAALVPHVATSSANQKTIASMFKSQRETQTPNQAVSTDADDEPL